MDSFLQQTAQSIIAHMDWQQLSRTTLVLPSHRAGLVLKDALLRLQQEGNRQAIWAPEVKTLQQLQDSLSPLYAEDELLTIVRLYRYYRQMNAGDEDLMPLDMFYGWGRQMLADFTNVDASMPAEQVPNFFENTIAAHELSQLDLDDEVVERLRALINPLNDAPGQQFADSIRNQYKKIWQQLYVFYQSLHAEMLAEHKGYSGMRQRAVIAQWQDESIQTQIQGRMYVFVGFNYLLPVERELMELLRDAGQALFYWDFVADFQANEKAFFFAKLNSGKLGSVLPPGSWNTPRQVTVMACSSREAQAQYVHNWLAKNYTEKGQKVGVVICDESMLESVIYTLPEITLPGEEKPASVNITKGFPLRNTHVFTQALSWLYDKARGDVEQVVSPDFIDDLLAALFPENPENPEDPEEAENTEMNWKDLLILESQYQVRKVANQMRLLIENGLGDVPFTLKLLRMLMRRTMENVTMPFHGEPITDIQVLGVLETRMLDFDKLLILNVEEGVLPQRQPDCSFIPYYLRKAYSMQTSDERATVYAYNFFRLLSRAGHSTLLFTTADCAENSKGMSRFLMQMLVSPQEFAVEKMRLEEPSVLDRIDDERLQTDGISMLSLLEKGADNILYRPDGTRYNLSPSALNTFISCPRKFCLTYIKGIREPEIEEIRFSPATLGTFVHNMMQYLYDNKSTLTPDEIGQILADEEMLEKALSEAYLKTIYDPDQHKPEKPVIMQFVRNILARDKADAENGLQIRMLEKDRKFDIDLGELGILQTGGRIDRLDRYGEKSAQVLRVIDYKSGTYHDKDMATTSEELMSSKDAKYIRQTLIYSHALLQSEKSDKPIEPNLFFCSRSLVGQKTTIAIDEKEINDYRTIQDDFIAALKEKAREVMTATSFPPCEQKECDPYCPFMESLCRRKVFRLE